jgi:hypothetical protein
LDQCLDGAPVWCHEDNRVARRHELGIDRRLLYYRLLNTLTRQQLGGLHSAKIVLYSADFAEIEQMQAEHRWDQAGEMLAEAGRGSTRPVLTSC